ncbi:hypothetical protein [Ureibacillus sinduriensis]|uniref:Type 4 fimbrial biogenesis protein PilX N-terminal domain-containing protein n=1 Tax=Ureibacillus sinduriensis BLB-1 = JCM 15800 TaxID=1384057 RepID=A0A0A3HN84_9BACL|nr:hypothetical protein [Ureibacillus sinduriensis]KGR74031.1 hypothetical protein CD33_18715 [Ureibacillus sinduriensis BLB-1 = JCM 15800]
MEQNLKNENGYSMLIAFLLLVFVSVIGISLLSLSSNVLKISSSERADQSTYYIAEAGLNREVSSLNNTILKTYETIKSFYNRLPDKDKATFNFEEEFFKAVALHVDTDTKTYTDFEPQFGEHPSAHIRISKINTTPLIYKITSTGNIDNHTRTVSQNITILFDVEETSKTTGLPPAKYAVHTYGDITMYGSAGIKGSVSSESGSISIIGNNSIDGKIGTTRSKFSYPSYKSDMVKQLIEPEPLPKNILPIFPDSKFSNWGEYSYPSNLKPFIQNGVLTTGTNSTKTIELQGDMHLKELKVVENINLSINVGSTDKNIFVDNLNILQGHITLNGTGKLNIYVKSSYAIKGSFNKSGSPERASIYYLGNNDFNITDETAMSANIFVKNANMNVANGWNGPSLKGNIYTGGSNLTISGAAGADGQHVYAPNAHVQLEGSAKVTGAIYARSFTASGNAQVVFAQGTGGNIGSGLTIIEYGQARKLTLSDSIIEEE